MSVVTTLKGLVAKAEAAVVGLWKKEPVRVTAVVAGAVTAVASVFGVVVPETTVLEALAYVLPFLLGGEVVRKSVTPTP